MKYILFWFELNEIIYKGFALVQLSQTETFIRFSKKLWEKGIYQQS